MTRGSEMTDGELEREAELTKWRVTAYANHARALRAEEDLRALQKKVKLLEEELKQLKNPRTRA